MYLRAAVSEAALLQSPGRDDVEALHHHGVRQQRGQIFGVGLGILVDPPVVADVHQDFACRPKTRQRHTRHLRSTGAAFGKTRAVRHWDEYSIVNLSRQSGDNLYVSLPALVASVIILMVFKVCRQIIITIKMDVLTHFRSNKHPNSLYFM